MRLREAIHDALQKNFMQQGLSGRVRAREGLQGLYVDFQSLPLEAVAGVPVLSDYDRFVGNRMSQESKRSAAGRCERVRLPNAPAVACGHGSQTRILCKTA